MNNKYIINWELSLNCNLDCSFCSQKERRNINRKNLSIENIYKIIDNLDSNSHISFLWWETLIFPNIIDIFKKLENKWITYEITTNGIFLEKFINDFKKLNNLTQINISIDWYWEVHDNSRWSKWLFKKIINIIPKIIPLKEINISTVITESLTDKNLLNLHILLNKLWIKIHKLVYLMNFSENDIKKSKEKINSLLISAPWNKWKERNSTYKKNFLQKYILLNKLWLDINISYEPENIFNKKQSFCKQIVKQYRINEKWNLSICEFINNKFSNLINNKFENAINNLQYKELKKEVINNFPLDICKTCCKNINK